MQMLKLLRIEFFSKSASKNELPEMVERLSSKSISPKSEKKTCNFINSESLIISDKKVIRLSEVNVFELRNEIYSHGSEFNYHSKSDVIVFS